MRNKYRIPHDKPYILSLCTLEPRKNLGTVIRSFLRLIQEPQHPDLTLVLVGTDGGGFNQVLQEIERQESLRGRIVVTGYVPDVDLAPLYGGALAFVYLSLYEGFGLPPLEAMQCGIPVIASNCSSLPEVVGDAGIMLDPLDEAGLCRSLHELYDNAALRRFLSMQSLKQAKHFSWERCLAETISAYRKALAG